jgi:dTDP-4-amino-4,6-dideoxygalactose transaminase
MVDLYNQYLGIKEEIDSAIFEVINSTSFIKGHQVWEFEKNLAKYHNVPEAVSCGNGTDALQISLMSFDFEPGDEIIVPAFTYVASAEAIALLRLKPVLVDVDYDSFNINTDLIEENITDKTKAIIPVHLFGQCSNMEIIMKIAQEKNLRVIEDNAQSIGAEYTFQNGNTKKSGTIGDIGCLSFFPSKNLGCFGDGGAMLFNDTELAKHSRMIANHGQRIKYTHDIIGCNSRLDTIQAGILNVKLKYLDEFISKRQIVAERYNKAFKQIPHILIPYKSRYSSHVYHQYTIKLSGDIERDKLQEKLRNKKIPSMVYYPMPLHMQKAFNGLYKKGSFPISERLCREVLSLPIHTEMSFNTQDFIVDNVIESIEEIKNE